MTTSQSIKASLGPTKLFALGVIWAAATVVLHLLTGSQWWLCAVGGAGAVALALSFILPESPAETEASPPSAADSEQSAADPKRSDADSA